MPQPQPSGQGKRCSSGMCRLRAGKRSSWLQVTASAGARCAPCFWASGDALSEAARAKDEPAPHLPVKPRGAWHGPLGNRARTTPCSPSPVGITSSPGSLLMTWQQTRCLMLPGKRQLVGAQSKMSPKCHSNFLSVHKMADAPFQWHVGFFLEQQHPAPIRCPPCHCSALA